MSGEGCERAFCREAVQQEAAAATAGAGGGGTCPGGSGGERSGFVDPRKYRNPLPFNLKNPYAFTTKFFLISTVGFAAPYLVVLYQMYKMGRTT
ncbi:hypothetical protein quinque_015824 [Culex quinquefasciatus]